MKYGAVNSYQNEIVDEILKISQEGFDFVDLTLEPAYRGSKNTAPIKEAVQKTGIELIGHTSAFLPYSFPLESIRIACREEFLSYLAFFAELDVAKVNVHPSSRAIFPLQDEKEYFFSVVDFVKQMDSAASGLGIELMFENSPGIFNTYESISVLFSEIPRLKFHMDVGHAYIAGGLKNVRSLFNSLREKTVHVHVSDNNGVSDDHIALGEGVIDWPAVASIIKETAYDDTITIEVFSDRREDLLKSRDYFTGLFGTA